MFGPRDTLYGYQHLPCACFLLGWASRFEIVYESALLMLSRTACLCHGEGSSILNPFLSKMSVVYRERRRPRREGESFAHRLFKVVALPFLVELPEPTVTVQ